MRVFFLSLLVELHSLRNVESIRPEQPVDLVLQLENVVFLKSILQHLRREDHHGLVEVLVCFLVCQNFGLELHKRAAVVDLLRGNRLVVVDNQRVLVRHRLRLLTELLFL